MSQRKLQQEIDKLLKKVKEGLEEFDSIYEKFQGTESSNISYREKLEGDLKREIKKLQKQRDQVKTWLSKEDVKDKDTVLMETRKLIENDMEKFKQIEKLMKTKQFSKEALTNPDIIKDPRELRKRDESLFIHECIDELTKQLESLEAQEDNEHQIERHEFHIANLENILKLLQNNELDPDKLNEFHDDIKYYVENNDDPDFIEYETIYEDIGCELNKAAIAAQQEESIKSTPKKSPTKKSSKISGSAAKRSPTPLAGTANANKNESSDKTKTIDIQETKTDKSKPEEINKSEDKPTKQAEDEQSNNEGDDNEDEDDDKEDDYVEPVDRTAEINEILQQDIQLNSTAMNNPLFKDEIQYWLESKRNLLQPIEDMTPAMIQQLESSLLNCPDSLDADSPSLYRKPLSQHHPTSIFFPNEPIRFVYPFYEQTQPNHQNGSEGRNNKHEDIYSRTSLAKIFNMFDLDTLFFIFYHYQGTYEQFLAARELAKIRNWQFNKKDRCWYYKEIEKLPPGMTKSEEESWRYFDFKKSWLSRRCGSDFVYNEADFEKLWYCNSITLVKALLNIVLF